MSVIMMPVHRLKIPVNPITKVIRLKIDDNENYDLPDYLTV